VIVEQQATQACWG